MKMTMKRRGKVKGDCRKDEGNMCSGGYVYTKVNDGKRS